MAYTCENTALAQGPCGACMSCLHNALAAKDAEIERLTKELAEARKESAEHLGALVNAQADADVSLKQRDEALATVGMAVEALKDVLDHIDDADPVFDEDGEAALGLIITSNDHVLVEARKALSNLHAAVQKRMRVEAQRRDVSSSGANLLRQIGGLDCPDCEARLTDLPDEGCSNPLHAASATLGADLDVLAALDAAEKGEG